MDQIDFSNTDWRYQLRILKIESKFLFIMDWVNYETSVVNPLKTNRKDDGRFPEETNSPRVL